MLRPQFHSRYHLCALQGQRYPHLDILSWPRKRLQSKLCSNYFALFAYFAVASSIRCLFYPARLDPAILHDEDWSSDEKTSAQAWKLSVTLVLILALDLSHAIASYQTSHIRWRLDDLEKRFKVWICPFVRPRACILIFRILFVKI